MTGVKTPMRYCVLIALVIRGGYTSSFDSYKFKQKRRVSLIELSRLKHYFRMKCKNINKRKINIKG